MYIIVNLYTIDIISSLLTEKLNTNWKHVYPWLIQHRFSLQILLIYAEINCRLIVDKHRAATILAHEEDRSLATL